MGIKSVSHGAVSCLTHAKHQSSVWITHRLPKTAISTVLVLLALYSQTPRTSHIRPRTCVLTRSLRTTSHPRLSAIFPGCRIFTQIYRAPLWDTDRAFVWSQDSENLRQSNGTLSASQQHKLLHTVSARQWGTNPVTKTQAGPGVVAHTFKHCGSKYKLWLQDQPGWHNTGSPKLSQSYTERPCLKTKQIKPTGRYY